MSDAAVAKKAFRVDESGWIYLHLEGEPYDRGVQQGRLLASEIARAISTAKFLTTWDTGEPFQTFVAAGLEQFSQAVDSEFLDEIRGIADGAKQAGLSTSFEEILAWNGYLDLLAGWWPNHLARSNPLLGADIFGSHRGHRCSAFIATGSFTKDGRIVMGHNTWDRYAAGDSLNIIFDIVPSAGNRILMQGVPGCISSLTDFWITSGGLIITETTISNFTGYNPSGAPEFYRSRRASQYASSIDEWCDMFAEGNNGGYVNSWLIGDIKTGEIAQYELGLRFRGLERTKNGFYSGFNTAVNTRIRTQECRNQSGEFTDIRKNGARRLRWMQISEKLRGELDVETAKSIIADHFDVHMNQRENPSSRTLCGHLELDDGRTGISAQGPFDPSGANDGKVVDTEMASALSLWARWGHACGMAFDAKAFFREHPQWSWLDGYMEDRPSYPWCRFQASLC